MLEGLTLDTYWNWKDTLGPLKDRPGFQGVWGYQQTHGLGIMEYLEWAEDMDLQIGESHVSPNLPSFIDSSQSSVSSPDTPSTEIVLQKRTYSPSSTTP